MSTRFRIGWPSPAVIVGCVALFAALAGSTYAATASGTRGERAARQATSVLARGVTLRGVFFVNSPVSSGGLVASEAISFGSKLKAAPTVHYIPSGANVPTGCSGSVSSPGAAPGNFCLFEKLSANGSGSEVNPLNGKPNRATSFGGGVQVVSAAGGAFNTAGSWAVTGS